MQVPILNGDSNCSSLSYGVYPLGAVARHSDGSPRRRYGPDNGPAGELTTVFPSRFGL